jgi:hypothetical protein
MPTIPFRYTGAGAIAAGATIPNALAGSQFEFLQRPSRVQIYLTQDPGDLAEAECFFGQEIEATAALIRESAAAASGPVVPDDLLVDDVGAPQDRLVIRITETGGINPAEVRGVVKITPIG